MKRNTGKYINPLRKISSVSELIIAYYDYYIAVAKLDYAVGR